MVQKTEEIAEFENGILKSLTFTTSRYGVPFDEAPIGTVFQFHPFFSLPDFRKVSETEAVNLSRVDSKPFHVRALDEIRYPGQAPLIIEIKMVDPARGDRDHR